MPHQFDLVCQLGSQVMYVDDQYKLATHTLMRTMASAIAYNKGIAPRLMVLGGSNFGVRYDDLAIFNEQHPRQKTPVFTFETFAASDYNRKSEAAAIKDFLVKEFYIPSDKVFAETLSATTDENAAFLAIILKRRPDPKSSKGILGVDIGSEKIGILTLLYHMERALPIFKKAGLTLSRCSPKTSWSWMRMRKHGKPNATLNWEIFPSMPIRSMKSASTTPRPRAASSMMLIASASSWWKARAWPK